jgi:hypothetical protein
MRNVTHVISDKHSTDDTKIIASWNNKKTKHVKNLPELSAGYNHYKQCKLLSKINV